MRALVWATFALLSTTVCGQGIPPGGSEDSTIRLSSRNLVKLSDAYSRTSFSIRQRSLRILQQMERAEQRLQAKLSEKNSILAAATCKASASVYEQYRSLLMQPSDLSNPHPLKDYLPGVDSLQTALQFLGSNKLATLSPAQLQSIGSLQSQFTGLQSRLGQATDIQTFLSQRQQAWQNALQPYGLTRELTTMRKNLYYYTDQVTQYKALLRDPDKLAEKVIAAVKDLPAFQKYFRSNSWLSMLFQLPGSNPADGTELPGLQTRSQVSALLAARLGSGASFPAAASGDAGSGNPLAASMETAQEQVSTLKEKLGLSGDPVNEEATAGFKPNSQHTKTFWHRLESGFNIQSTGSTPLIPAYTDIALTLGYKLNDRSVVGIGAAYKLGWGHPFQHIELSSQGVGLRSFLDWKIKGGLWLSGGYEANYLSAFSSLRAIRDISVWQRSGLIGLKKTYKAGKRSGNIQLLYDLLYQQHVPQSKPLIFRVGYSLN